MPPEKLAYALARYSRSPDSISESIEWVRTHDSSKFLESFYFQYGHASIADLGHATLCFEGVSELAATEIEDEPLWDGQARSSRYQDFAQSGVIVPPEFAFEEQQLYLVTAAKLLTAYGEVRSRAGEYLKTQLPCPADMKRDTYERNIAARAFDIARYLLPFGIPTGVGQVTSVRTLEKQIRRLRGSEFEELRDLGYELSAACAAPPACLWDQDRPAEPVAPTLARHGEPDEFSRRLRTNLTEWAVDHLPPRTDPPTLPGMEPCVDLLQPEDVVADLCASLLYPVTTRPFRELYDLMRQWPKAKQEEILTIACGSRGQHDELSKHFRSAPFVFDIVMDIGAYRDMHRHRRCHQLRQQYTDQLGYSTPAAAEKCGAVQLFTDSYAAASRAMEQLPQPAAQYLLPFGSNSRFLFKMDFAELDYISRLRSGVKGHFSYRKVAWEMKMALGRVSPFLGSLVSATPPWVEDPLKR